MNDVLGNKIESIRRCVARIEAVRPQSAEALLEDVDAQDILCINLERAVQLAVDIAAMLIVQRELAPPDTMADAFRALQQADIVDDAMADKLIKAVGFRNIAVHTYRAIDWQLVFNIAQQAPDDLRAFVRMVGDSVESGP